MSAKTVMHHSVAIYRKLDVRGRAGRQRLGRPARGDGRLIVR